MELTGYDHVNLAMPANEQDKARTFYGGVLGLTELTKPDVIAGRGTLWFGGDHVTVHLGVEDGFRPARRAHPAFRVKGLEELRLACEAAGHETIVDHNIPGWDRFFVYDPFGNRIECMEQIEG
jgi:catechol 2,3-dioxygenase-like lactoylglutathione lyase family enzyme